MSIGYKIENGIVVGTEFCFSSHKTETGYLVKPETYEQERRLKRSMELTETMQLLQKELQEKKKSLEQSMGGAMTLSALQGQAAAQEKISRELTEQMELLMEELDQTEHTVLAPGQVGELMGHWGSLLKQGQGNDCAALAAMVGRGYGLLEQIRRKQLSSMADRQNGLLQITALEKELDELEELVFTMETTEGTVQLSAQVNERTGQQMVKIREKLKTLDGELQKEDRSPEEIEKSLKRLQAVREDISALEPKAKEVFNTQIWRQQQAMTVTARLQEADSGWRVTEVRQGDGLFDDLKLFLEGDQKNAVGKLHKAVVSFAIDGTIRIDSFFEEDALGTRGKLQQLILKTLQAGGATGAVGTCMDHGNEKETERGTSAGGEAWTPAAAGKQYDPRTQQAVDVVQTQYEKESKQKSRSTL